MHDLEWARYMCESVYCLWVQVMCGVIQHYREFQPELVNFARRLLSYVSAKLQPMRETEILYRRMFEACGKAGLSQHLKELFAEL